MSVIDPSESLSRDTEALQSMLPDGDPKRRGPSWNPFWRLFGPTFQRDMIVTGRKKGTYKNRVFFAGAMLLLLSFTTYFFLQTTSASGAGRAQAYQGMPPIFALVTLWYVYVLLTLLAPSLTGGAVCDERRARTLPSLMTTPLPNSEMILGRYMSRLLLALVLGLIIAPVLLGARLFGGLDFEPVVKMIAIIVSSVALGISLGLLCSVHSKRSSSAALQGVLLQGFLTLSPIILLFAINRPRMMSGEPPIDGTWFFNVCAPAQMVMQSIFVTAGGIGGGGGGGGGGPPGLTASGWMYSIAYNLGWTVIALLVAVVRFRKLMTSEKTFEAVVESKRERARRKRAEGLQKRHADRVAGGAADIDPEADQAEGEQGTSVDVQGPDAEAPSEDAAAPAKKELEFAEGSRTVSNRPLLWRELRQPVFSRVRTGILTFGVIILAAGLGYWRFGLESVMFSVILGFAGLIAVISQIANQTTGVIIAEKEARTWETLLTTPVSARAILYAKALGGLRQIWVVPAVFLGHFIILTSWGGTEPIFMLHLAFILLAAIGMLTGTGVLFGLISKRAVQASTLNFGLAAVLWMVLPIALFVASNVMSSNINQAFFPRAISFLSDILLSINPFVMFFEAFGDARTDKMVGMVDQSSLDVPIWRRIFGNNPELSGFTVWLGVLATLSIGIGVGAIELAKRIFAGATGRTS